MKKKLKAHYSGNLSIPFWKKINALVDIDNKKWNRLYSMGCKLQNLEGDVLRLLGEK